MRISQRLCHQVASHLSVAALVALSLHIPIATSAQEASTIRALVVDPHMPSTLYAASSCGGVAKSTDGGVHWGRADTGITYDDIRALAIDSATPSILYAGTNLGTVYKTRNAAADWSCLCPRIAAEGIASLAVDRGALYAGIESRSPGSVGGSLFLNIVGGRPSQSAGLADTGVLALAIAPGSASPPTTLYVSLDSAPHYPGGLFKTNDGSTTWRLLEKGLPGTPVSALASDPKNPDTVYAGTLGTGVFKSTDGGANWTATDDQGRSIRALIIDPLTTTILYAGTTEGVFKSTDAGRTWQVSNNTLAGDIRALAIDPQEPSRLWAGTDGGDVFASTNGGGGWTTTGLVAAAACGDARLSTSCAAPERCDDGNLINGDGCDENCTLTACGNAVVSAGEGCDDGNTRRCDGCSPTCQTEAGFRCGDGVVSSLCSPEVCDDGNPVDGDGCDSNCTPTGCGNGIETTGEECDYGDVVSGDGCDETCRLEFCGDGVVQTRRNEICDDGNSVACDGCSPYCREEVGFRCGDGVVSSLCGPERCDDGNQIDGDGCDTNCTPTECGNAILSADEECDDSGQDWFDGCTGACTVCGNQVVTPPEHCDDGNNVGIDGCTNGCTRCGDGTVTAPESCDDGNLVDGDGCNADCIIPGCGNDVRETDEDCDDGGRCVGSANAGAFCTSDALCPGGDCVTFGGDGCAANCTSEHDIEFPLTPGRYDVESYLSPGTSGLLLRGHYLTVAVPLSGSLTLTMGRDRGNHLIPVVIRATSVRFPPERLSEHFFGCVRGIPFKTCGGLEGDAGDALAARNCTLDSDVCAGDLPCTFVHGAGNAAAGVIDCNDGLVDGVDVEVIHDAITGVRETSFNGTGGPGSARISASFVTTTIWETSCYSVFAPESEVGSDRICCTEDDPIPPSASLLTASALTTGTATGTIVGDNGEPGSILGPFAVTGMPFDCRALAAATVRAGSAGLVNASTQLGLSTFGDIVMLYQLFTPAFCMGDCHGDGAVTIDELLAMVDIALGHGNIDACTPGDTNRDGLITIDEIVAALNMALAGCSQTAGD